jgi:uncharacterized protein YoxC
MDAQLFIYAKSALFFALTLAVVVVLIYLYPMMKQLTETVRSTKELLSTVDAGLKPLLEEITTSVEKINNMLAELESAVEHIKHFSKIISETGKQVHTFNEILKETGESMGKKGSRFGAGIKTAFSVISKGVSRGEKKHDQREGQENFNGRETS